MSTVALLLALGVGACSKGGDAPTRTDGGAGGDAGVDMFVGGCDAMRDEDMDGIADLLDADSDPDEDGIPSRRDDDSDGDGWLDREEVRGANPCGPADSDGDGTPDFLDPDSDNDGVRDSRERMLGTDPTSDDSDDDGVSDLVEDVAGTDPNSAASTIPPDDFYVVLPYEEPEQTRTLRFGTEIGRADVYFLLDTTGTMGEELGALQAGMRDVILPGLTDLIADVEVGFGGFTDYPSFISSAYYTFGHGNIGDLPYYHLGDIAPLDADAGRWDVPGTAPPAPVRGRFALFPNGLPDPADFVNAYTIFGGGNGCESGAQALHMLATGLGTSWPESMSGVAPPYFTSPAGSIPPRTCPVYPDDPGPRRGYPCFRAGALPIVLYVSDAPLHEPLPADFGVNSDDPGSGSSCRYDEIPGVPSYDDAIAALDALGARVLALSTDEIPSRPTYPATDHLCRIAAATGAVREDGTPLCFELGRDGLGPPGGEPIAPQILEAVGALVGGTPQDVTTREENVAGNPGDVDATRFIIGIEPVEGYRGGVAGTGYRARNATGFEGVLPGTLVDFRLRFENTFVEETAVARLYRARIVVVGNGVADLDVREVYIVVPANRVDVVLI
jgi:hypothetical protein